MTTPLEKTLKRALTINGHEYVLAISPEGLKLTVKGKRNGAELKWESLISGEAALAVALQASVGKFDAPPAATSGKPQARSNTQRPEAPKSRAPRPGPGPAHRSKRNP